MLASDHIQGQQACGCIPPQSFLNTLSFVMWSPVGGHKGLPSLCSAVLLVPAHMLTIKMSRAWRSHYVDLANALKQAGVGWMSRPGRKVNGVCSLLELPP